MIEEKRLTIYVAGPFTGTSYEDITRKVNQAIQAGIDVIKKGHHPYIPHLTYYVAAHPMCPYSQLDRRWIDIDSPWVKLCDAIYIIPSSYEKANEYNTRGVTVEMMTFFPDGRNIVWKSRGAKFEYENAVKAGKKVFMSLEEIPQLSDFSTEH